MAKAASDNGAPEKTCADKAGPVQILSKSAKRSAERVALSPRIRGAIYTRFSTRFQHSTPDQVRACQKWADDHGVTVNPAHVISDEATSGRKNRRAGLSKLMKLIEDEEIDVVITFATNRLHRKVPAALYFVQSCIVERRKRCVFVSQGIDSEVNDHWELLLRVHSMLDELQVKMAGGFIREAHVGLLRQGFVHGTLPFGYVGIPIEGERPTRQKKARCRIAIDTNGAAPWVRRIFEWYVRDRLDFHDIARRLLTEGAPPPPKVARWTWTAVKRVIRNQRYVGDWSYGIFRTVWQSKADYGRQIRQESPYHPYQIDSLRIIDDDLFARAQEIADFKVHRGGRKRRSPAGESVRDALKGLLYCPLHGVPLRSTGTDAGCYGCPRCKKIGQEQHLFSIANRHLARRKICEAILAWLRSQPALVDQIVERSRARLAEAVKQDRRPAEKLKVQLESVERRLNLAIRHAVGSDGEHLVEELAGERDQLRRELKELDRQQVEPPAPPTAEQVRARLDQMETLLENHSQNPEVASQLNELLRQLSGGRIEMEQAGERKHHRGWLRAKFDLHLNPGSNYGSNDQDRPSLTVDIREETKADQFADQIKAMWDANMRVGQIARQLGRGWSFVRAALEAWHRQRGLPLPDIAGRDRTIRRSSPSDARYREIAEAAWAHYESGKPLGAIAALLGVCRPTLDAAIKHAASTKGIGLPDGRARRKMLGGDAS